MRPKNNNSDGQEQRANEQSGETGMQGPRAASERAVQEAERKAEDAHQHADDVHKELQEEVTDLRFRLEEQREYIEKLDRLLNAVYRMAETREGENPLNAEMPHVVPENREEDAQTGEVMLEVEGETDE